MRNFHLGVELLRYINREVYCFVFDSFVADGAAGVYAQYPGDAGAAGIAAGLRSGGRKCSAACCVAVTVLL